MTEGVRALFGAPDGSGTLHLASADSVFAPDLHLRSRESTVGVTEYERHRLFTWFEEQMGQERASTLMDMLPTTGFGDLVTRHDLRDVETSIRQDLVALESRLTARFVGWLLASQAVTISVVGVLTSLR